MAATPVDVVSLEAMKLELRIEPDETDHDAMLTAQIGAAVSFVGRAIKEPLVDVTDTLKCPRPSGDAAVVLYASAITAVTSVRYWTTDGSLRAAPDGTVDIATLGRREAFDRGRCTRQYPPADGWPETLSSSRVWFDVTRGFVLEDKHESIKQAIILCVRQLYDGSIQIRPTEAFFSFIDPWRDLG